MDGEARAGARGDDASAAAEMAQVRAQLTRDGLPLVLRSLALIYALWTLWHALAPGALRPLAILTGATAALLLAGAATLVRRPTPLGRVHLAALGAALLVLLNIDVAYALRPGPLIANDYSLFMVCAGALLFDRRAFVFALVAALGSWGVMTALALDQPEAVATIGPVVASAVAGMMIRLVHHRIESRALAAQARVREAQTLEAVGRLAGGVAHDFNNLLCIVRMNDRWALRQAEQRNDPRLRAALEDSLAATERAAVLTHDLLAVARRQHLDPRVVDLGDIVTGSARQLAQLLGDAVELRVDAPRSIAPVRVDPSLVERTLLSLTLAAREAMPTGGRFTLQVDVVEQDGAGDTLPPGPYVALRASDTGAGLEPAAVDKLFEPFFTARGQGGGIGLATIYGAVRQSGGIMTVRSRRGVGTTFEILLPRVSGARGAETAAQVAQDQHTGDEQWRPGQEADDRQQEIATEPSHRGD